MVAQIPNIPITANLQMLYNLCREMVNELNARNDGYSYAITICDNVPSILQIEPTTGVSVKWQIEQIKLVVNFK